MGVLPAPKCVMAGAGERIHIVKRPHDFLVRKRASQRSHATKPVQIMEMNDFCTLECYGEIPAQIVPDQRNWRIKTLLSDDELVETRSECVEWGREWL